MTVVAVGSVSGSPGATTAAVALAAAWPGDGPRVVVEADADGGVLAARFGLAPDPGLVSLAAASRREEGAPLMAHTQDLPGGLPVVVAPPGPEQAAGAVAAVAAHWRPVEETVVVDCGRLVGRSPSLELARAADVLLVACRPRVDEAAALAQHASTLRVLAPRVGLLAVGRDPYSPEELADAVGLELVATVEDDPLGAHLAGGGHGSARALHRSALLRSARTAAFALTPEPVT